jgi:hypothetical protein
MHTDIHASNGIRTLDPSVQAIKAVYASDRAATVIGQLILRYVISTFRAASLSKLKTNRSNFKTFRRLHAHTHNLLGTVEISGFLNYLTYYVDDFSSFICINLWYVMPFLYVKIQHLICDVDAITYTCVCRCCPQLYYSVYQPEERDGTTAFIASHLL